MKRYSWIVLTNCTPGSENAYEDWYQNTHVPDLLRVPGIVSVTRGTASPFQTAMIDGVIAPSGKAQPHYQFMATYTFETDDPEGVLAEVVARANTPEMMISADMTEAYTLLVEDKA